MKEGEFITFDDYIKHVWNNHRRIVEAWLREERAREIVRDHGGVEFSDYKYHDPDLDWLDYPTCPDIRRPPALDDVGAFSEVELKVWQGKDHTPQFVDCTMMVVTVSDDQIEGIVSSDYAKPRGRMIATKDCVFAFSQILRTDDSESHQDFDDDIPW